VDVGISEHTVNVCAMLTNDANPRRIHSLHVVVREVTRACRAPFAVHWRNDMVKGLGTVVYHVSDLARAKEWYAQAFQQPPYFDQPFYVGFNIGGYELGLDPNTKLVPPGIGGSVTYWRVDDVDVAVQHFVAAGALVVEPVQDVGDGIIVATVKDPFGNAIGLIKNPYFALPKE
jgi:predicted enzyme related to lactoylglutathione lyase